jgi:SAM-dependent methyltransferase
LHTSCVTWVAVQVIQWALADKYTLEVGSLNVNGSVRSLFTGNYIGVDLQEGPGVDRVMDGEALEYPDHHFEVVVCTETLEHMKRPWVAVSEMVRVLDFGGSVLLTGRGFDERGAFPLHEYPQDMNRFSLVGIRGLVEDAGMSVKDIIADWEAPGYFILGTK